MDSERQGSPSRDDVFGPDPEASFTPSQPATAGSESVSAETGPLLDDIAAFIRLYIVLSQAQACLCALWVLHTHALPAFDFTPYLQIHSAVLRSGKTNLLEVLRLLVHRPWLTAHVTPAVLVRKTHLEHPTLLLDESDATFNAKNDYNDILRGILDTGFERDGTYSMCVAKKGGNWEPRDFSTFCAKAICGIGKLPVTIQNRAVPIKLKRARKEDARQRFRKRAARADGETLRQRIEQWAKLNTAKLREARPELPDALNDRQMDVCEPLVAIADAAGGAWPSRARSALVALCTNQQIADDSTGLRLLADIREVFSGADEIRTEDLLSRLNALGESPWSELDRGRPLRSYGLAKLLEPFDIEPKTIRFNSSVRRGYKQSDFEDCWARYLGPPLPVPGLNPLHPLQANVYAGPRPFLEALHRLDVVLQNQRESPVFTRVVAGVAASGPTARRNGAFCRIHPANATNWWLRGEDAVCALCHPDPGAKQQRGT